MNPANRLGLPAGRSAAWARGRLRGSILFPWESRVKLKMSLDRTLKPQRKIRTPPRILCPRIEDRVSDHAVGRVAQLQGRAPSGRAWGCLERPNARRFSLVDTRHWHRGSLCPRLRGTIDLPVSGSCHGRSRKFLDGEKPMGSQSFFYAKAAPSAAAVPVNTAHQPKTMASAVPRFTLPTHVKPMAVRISVQIRKISNEEARP
jgi:hypothetical protein